MCSPGISFREKNNLPSCKVFATYDTVPAGHRAIEYVERSSERFEIKLFLHRFDSIDSPAEFQQATAEATEAQLILVSSWNRDEFPEVICRLLKSCAASREKGEVTIVEVIGSEGSIEATDLLNSRFVK